MRGGSTSTSCGARWDNVGYPILPLVHQLAAQCGEAGRWLHWGVTTQDIMDAAVVLQIRDRLALVEADVAAVRAILADLARRHRDTPTAGRTHLQHALPVTFGTKAAVWLAMFDHRAERLEQLRPRVLVGQFAGAACTSKPRSPRSANAAWRCRRRSWPNLTWAPPSRPGTSRATASPRRSTCWR